MFEEFLFRFLIFQEKENWLRFVCPIENIFSINLNSFETVNIFDIE